jgi:hypothetical protein
MNFKLLLVMVLAIAMTGMLSIVTTAQVAAQGQSTALERGYRTGYSDGYTAGFHDVTERAARDYQNKEDYKRADRSYNEAWGPIDDYRDGYRQGFEKGYATGYERAQFDSTLPAGFGRRGNAGPVETSSAEPTQNTTTDATVDTQNVPVNTQNAGGQIAIPRNTILALELLTPLSTDATQPGDRFQARVVEPKRYEGFIVEGRVSQVKRPGKVKGVAELQLAFDQIRSTDHRTASLRAELLEITPMGDEAPEVDSEGGVRGKDSTKDDAAKVGAASGIGAIIGTIAGGGKGAAIGAIIGGGAGTAGVMTQRGKDVRLERGQQLKIRTSTDTGVQ